MLRFPMLHKLCENYRSDNEEAQHDEYNEAIGRRRHVFWQLSHNQIFRVQRPRRIDLDQVF